MGITSDMGIVVLAGGGGQRLGGVSKADLLVGGKRLLDWSLSSLPPAPCVVVAPQSVAVPQGVGLVMEDPPGSGPAAGFAAGVSWLIRHSPTPLTTVGLVPVDAPWAGKCLPLLLQALSETSLPAVLARSQGVVQNVIGVFRLDSLRPAFAPGVVNTSMRRVLSRLETGVRDVPAAFTKDADTPADLAELSQILLSETGN